MQTEQVLLVLEGVPMLQVEQLLASQVVLMVPELHFGRLCHVLLNVCESNPC